MLRKLMRDLNSRPPRIHTCNTGPLQEYYLVFEDDPKRLNRLIRSYDAQGIPLNEAYIDVPDRKLHYYPISIGQFGLAVYHTWLRTGEEEKKLHFLRIADWFMDHAICSPSLGAYWLTEVPKPEYRVSTPWRSAFSQSRALSILCRAWQLTRDEKYLSIAEQALIPFGLDISENGVSVDRNRGECFYEEYVAQWPTRVLDGHLFSLMGLYDYIRVGRGEALACAKLRFQEGVEGLIQTLPAYDLGYWLRFNRCDMPGYPKDDPCTIGYLRLVIAQLSILADISSRAELKAYAVRFRTYDTLPNLLRMYILKFKSLKQLNRL